MRSKLMDICTTADNLAMGLSKNGLQHRRYKMYTSMERALEILRSGNMYFSTGRNWNDLQDRELMSRGRQYGGCYSWSTVENIAMWMLYGAECGKNGAMLDFPKSIMAELVSSEYIEVGSFENGTFVTKAKLLAGQDFHIKLIDVIYSQFSKKGDRVMLTLGDEHVIVPAECLNHADIFHKYYAWAYERECRLIIHVNEGVMADMELPPVARIRLSENAVRIMKDNLYRSPIFDGSCDLGKPSKLFNLVEWKL